MSTTMRAVQVNAWGEVPTFSDAATIPQNPSKDSSLVQIRVIASGLHQLVRGQSSGKHYSAKLTALPYIPGSDGVGETLQGDLVYFDSYKSGGAMAEYVNVPQSSVFPMPISATATKEERKALAIKVASLFNPTMSSWMALHCRVSEVPIDATILILGVTGFSGQIAVKNARHLGFKTVIGVARNEKAMAQLGLDIAIKLEDDVTSTDFTSLFQTQSVDVVLDYLYGPPALHLLKCLPSNPMVAYPTQYVNIGSVAGQQIDLPSAILRSKNLTIGGSGFGSWSTTKDIATYFPTCLARICEDGDFEAGIPQARQRQFEQATEAWNDKERSVFVS